jgi:ABC-2 type transport system permease protein
MKLALWRQSFHDARWLLLACTVAMFGYLWIWVWLTSLIKMSQFRRLLEYAPDFILKQLPVSVEFIATSLGRVARGYEEPLVLAMICSWAIARGSDAVSGPIGRGTMEMLLSHPVRRFQVFTSQAIITLSGCVLIAICGWLGTWVGIARIELEQPVNPWNVWPAMVNLGAFGICIAGIATLLSSYDQHRARTIGLSVGFFALQYVLKIVGKTTEDLSVYLDMTILTLFEPVVLVAEFFQQTERAWPMFWQYNGTLVGIGLASYALAAAIFCHRDLPPPL